MWLIILNSQLCRKATQKAETRAFYFMVKNALIKLVNFKKNSNDKNIKDNSYMYKHSLFCVVHTKNKTHLFKDQV